MSLDERPSTLQLVTALRSWVDQHQESTEYADLAKKAAADTIAAWYRLQGQQLMLFMDPGDPREVWRRADNGAGFCEVARLFFAKFTERYLNYFLGREASAVMAGVRERERLASGLREHVDDVSKYAFEVSRITQSFAAGWFKTHAATEVPDNDALQVFLFVAFGKMREELLREATRHG